MLEAALTLIAGLEHHGRVVGGVLGGRGGPPPLLRCRGCMTGAMGASGALLPAHSARCRPGWQALGRRCLRHGASGSVRHGLQLIKTTKTRNALLGVARLLQEGTERSATSIALVA